ncbi:hypothetical protein NQ318_001340, partial [Aromia moschata]
NHGTPKTITVDEDEILIRVSENPGLSTRRYCLNIYQLAYNLLSFYKICKPKTQIFLIRFYIRMRRHLLNEEFLIGTTHLLNFKNPHAVKERHFNVNFLCGVISNFVIGPFELPPNLTGLLTLSSISFTELLEYVPLALRENMWFMHDAVPPHFALQVR